jgi:uncharacterized protein YgbK (DUF1537 family)
MPILLGCIADDFTGATDLANTLVQRGMPTVQTIGVPQRDDLAGDAAAVVVALKSRTAPVDDAVAESLDALDWLRERGARQVFFKYCSTFDSTDAGNIGPVADALLVALGADFSIACPAFPTNKRTIYKGYLFVGDVLLNESGMQHHPLTPMTDANLVRVLGRQTAGKVGLVQADTVDRGAEAIAEAFAQLRAGGHRYAIVDALHDDHLLHVGTACGALALITGGSGVAMGLPENFRRQGLLEAGATTALPQVAGPAAVLSGSCSTATQAQVALMRQDHAALELDPLAGQSAAAMAKAAVDWAKPQLGDKPVLIYSTAAPDKVAAAQEALGRDAASALLEDAMGAIAQALVQAGVRRLIVAGGETAGAVVGALGVEGLRIGPEIDPGVPWTTTLGDPELALALKSGNFGSEDFFTKAFSRLG